MERWQATKGEPNSTTTSLWTLRSSDPGPAVVDTESAVRTDTSQPRLFLEVTRFQRPQQRKEIYLWAMDPTTTAEQPNFRTQALLAWSVNKDGTKVFMTCPRQKGLPQYQVLSPQLVLSPKARGAEMNGILTRAQNPFRFKFLRKKTALERMLEETSPKVGTATRHAPAPKKRYIREYSDNRDRVDHGSSSSISSRRGSIDSCASWGSYDSGISHPPGARRKHKKIVSTGSISGGTDGRRTSLDQQDPARSHDEVNGKGRKTI